jgi:hypothetical protein
LKVHNFKANFCLQGKKEMTRETASFDWGVQCPIEALDLTAQVVEENLPSIKSADLRRLGQTTVERVGYIREDLAEDVFDPEVAQSKLMLLYLSEFKMFKDTPVAKGLCTGIIAVGHAICASKENESESWQAVSERWQAAKQATNRTNIPDETLWCGPAFQFERAAA